MGKHNIRLKDIALQLGLSVPTVSRALNNKPDIGPETKKKVVDLARALNYQPNQFAINFKNQQTYIIGVVIPQIVHHFFSNVISGIINKAEKEGYSIMLFQSNESYESEYKGVNTFQKSMIDGLIISLSDNTSDYQHLINLQEHKIPVVLIDKITDKVKANKIVCDDYKGSYFATEHLISLGKKKLAHITGSLKPFTTQERNRGFITALKDYGMTVNANFIKNCDLVSSEEGYMCMLELLSGHEIPDAVFCATDPTAIGAIKAIKEKGLKIPEDIAIIGFSNWDMSKVVDPPLSSVTQPDYEMGKKAVELIIKEISLTKEDKKIHYKTYVMETSLVLRESTLGKKNNTSF